MLADNGIFFLLRIWMFGQLVADDLRILLSLVRHTSNYAKRDGERSIVSLDA